MGRRIRRVTARMASCKSNFCVVLLPQAHQKRICLFAVIAGRKAVRPKLSIVLIGEVWSNGLTISPQNRMQTTWNGIGQPKRSTSRFKAASPT
jgi:hypothetical protein